ncbi:hypothetical protein SCUCBS95973_006945 [Sporothrix curviconia]|uniref:Zn(2)-C6 fungal-type domain-containing protein n=1 Tax=Sporothrix curviconia TaxID=1260050 RepID=A0ABP0CBW8_9PEZI
MHRPTKAAETWQRVSVACSACRKKRMRCDGNVPSCASCLAKGIDCEYQLRENKRKPPSKRYVESLQARIRVLEAQVAVLTKDGAGQPSQQSQPADARHKRSRHGSMDEACPPEDTDDVPSLEGYGGDGSGPSERSYIDDGDDHDDNDDDTASASSEGLISELTDTCGRLNLDEDGQLHFFGSQSNYHLLHFHINNQNTAGPGLASVPVPPTRITAAVAVPLDLQLHLLNLFFRWQNPWIYLVDKAIFMRDYYSGDRTRYCTPLLLLAIFTIASRFSDHVGVRSDPGDPSTAGFLYAAHAKALVNQEIDTVCITTVQAVAVLSLCWIGENRESAGWLYSGMASKMAFNLGLHLDCDNMVKSGLISQDEGDLRKAVWLGCYALDKNFSLGLGRPGNTPDRNITCGKPRLCAVAEFEPWLASDEADRTQSACIRVWHRYPTTYVANSQLSKAEMNILVSEADVAMATFWARLPSYLRLPNTPSVPALPHYHVSQILLHRPLVRRGRSKGKASGGAAAAGQSPQSADDEDLHLKVCRASASDITRILQIHKRHYSLRYTVMGFVCHTFAAASIHLLDAKSSDPTLRQQGLRKLRICMSALYEIGTLWPWSYRALRAVQLLVNVWVLAEKKSVAAKAADNAEHRSSNSNSSSGSGSSSAVHQMAGVEQDANRWSQGGMAPQANPAMPSDLAVFAPNFDPSIYWPNSPGSGSGSVNGSGIGDGNGGGNSGGNSGGNGNDYSQLDFSWMFNPDSCNTVGSFLEADLSDVLWSDLV